MKCSIFSLVFVGVLAQLVGQPNPPHNLVAFQLYNTAAEFKWEQDSTFVSFWTVYRRCDVRVDNGRDTTVTTLERFYVDSVPRGSICRYWITSCTLTICSEDSEVVTVKYSDFDSTDDTSVIIPQNLDGSDLYPSAPPILAVEQRVPLEITVTVNVPAYTGLENTPVVGWRLQLSESKFFETVSLHQDTWDSSLRVLQLTEGLQRGKRYYVRVAAANQQGFGPFGQWLDAVGQQNVFVATGVPGAPTLLTPTIPQPLTMRFQWVAPRDTGALDSTVLIINYRLTLDDDPNFGSPNKVSETFTGAYTEITVDGLKAGTKYHAKLEAQNNFGWSSSADYFGGSENTNVLAVGLPSVPTISDRQICDGFQQFTIFFTAPTDTGGGPHAVNLVSYLVEVDDKPQFTSLNYRQEFFIGENADKNYELTIAEPLTGVLFVRISFANFLGYGPSVFFRACAVPSAPQLAKLEVWSEGELRLGFDVPLNTLDGSLPDVPPTHSFRIQCDNDFTFAHPDYSVVVKPVFEQHDPTAPLFLHTVRQNLTVGELYYCRVGAGNRIAWGPWSMFLQGVRVSGEFWLQHTQGGKYANV